jgi:hypothetical protein
MSGQRAHGPFVIHPAGLDQVDADRGVEFGYLIVGVGQYPHLFTVLDRVGGVVCERIGPFDLRAVDTDQVLLGKGVEGVAGVLPGAHRQTHLCVVGVGEPMHRGQFQRGLWCGEAGRQVEYSAAADGRELAPVAHQHDPGVVLIGNVKEGMGGVLVKHPGLVHLCRSRHRSTYAELAIMPICGCVSCGSPAGVGFSPMVVSMRSA